MNNLEGYRELEEKIEYKFSDPSLILQALTHSSYVNEVRIKKAHDYERIEFLGDAVLEVTVSEYLFKNKPNMREGDMTKLRASLVCEPTLAYIARTALNLQDYLLLGKGEENCGGRNRDSIISDVFEAIIGALYLDGGIGVASQFINKYVLTDMEKKIEFSDSKTILQEYAQMKGYSLDYELVESYGPEHDRVYVMSAKLGDLYCESAEGRSKKAAEQKAAYKILQLINEK